MLPFLKKRNETGISSPMVKTREPDKKPESNEDNHSAAIEACAHDLINAIHSNDVKAVADALASAFEILDSMPHEEGEHIEPHSYDAQKGE